MLKNEEKVINILNKIDILISIIDKLNSKQRMEKRNSEVLDIKNFQSIELKNDMFKNLSVFIKENLEKKRDIYEKLANLEKVLEKDFGDIKEKIENQIKAIEENSLSQIYKKAKKMIYVAKWQKVQIEKEYYLSKDSLIDKITGKSKFKKCMVENKELKGKLIKKEYYEIKDTYEGQNIREILNMMKNLSYKNNDIIEFEEKLINSYMIDKETLKININDNWNIANLVPTGFFEQRKYYKTLVKKIEKENKKMVELLETNLIKVNETVNKFDILINMNKNLKEILNNI